MSTTAKPIRKKKTKKPKKSVAALKHKLLFLKQDLPKSRPARTGLRLGERMTPDSLRTLAGELVKVTVALKVPGAAAAPALLQLRVDPVVWTVAELNLPILRRIADLAHDTGIGADAMTEIFAQSLALHQGRLDIGFIEKRLAAARRLVSEAHNDLDRLASEGLAAFFAELGPDEQDQLLSDLGEVLQIQGTRNQRVQAQRGKTDKKLHGKAKAAEEEVNLLQVLTALRDGQAVDRQSLNDAYDTLSAYGTGTAAATTAARGRRQHGR